MKSIRLSCETLNNAAWCDCVGVVFDVAMPDECCNATAKYWLLVVGTNITYFCIFFLFAPIVAVLFADIECMLCKYSRRFFCGNEFLRKIRKCFFIAIIICIFPLFIRRNVLLLLLPARSIHSCVQRKINCAIAFQFFHYKNLPWKRFSLLLWL